MYDRVRTASSLTQWSACLKGARQWCGWQFPWRSDITGPTIHTKKACLYIYDDLKTATATTDEDGAKRSSIYRCFLLFFSKDEQSIRGESTPDQLMDNRVRIISERRRKRRRRLIMFSRELSTVFSHPVSCILLRGGA